MRAGYFCDSNIGEHQKDAVPVPELHQRALITS